MKLLPNFLTSSRIVLACILLLFFDKITPAFTVIFTIAMLTDLFDGLIARKLGVASSTGALLDSVADFLLDATIVKTVFSMKVMTKNLTIWMLISLGIGAISPIINYIKHKKVFFIHSIICKLCMFLLFGIPFAIQLGFIGKYLIFTLSVISVAMIELVFISIFLKEPDPDAKGIWSVIKSNKDKKLNFITNGDSYV